MKRAASPTREGRVFALTLAGGFLVVSFVGYWNASVAVATVALWLTVISLLAAVLVPGRLGPVMRAWMKLGEALGYVTTPILMAIVYYVIVTPTGIVRRVVSRRRRVNVESGWHARPPLPPRERLERQF